MQNYVTGCTVVMNRHLLNCCLPVPPQAVMHDWWFALVAAVLGKTVFLDEPTVLYRQHGGNVIGVKGFFSAISIARLFGLKEREKEIAGAFAQAAAMYEHLSGLDISEDAKRKLLEFRKILDGIGRGSFGTFKAFRQYGVGKQGIIRNLLFYLIIIYKRGKLL